MLNQLVILMRPHQWTKNLVLFAGLIFSRHALDIPLLARAGAAFGFFCLLSASVYAVNDVVDARKDRLHPVKSNRPVASGRLSPGTALAAAVVCGALGTVGSFTLGANFGALALLYLALNLAYSVGLKNLVILDVLSISVGFVMRAIGGVEALVPVEPGIILSPWLLVCTLFLALFLALCKRRQEISSLEGASDHRRSLGEYSSGLLDLMIGSVAAILVLSYSLYTIWPGTVDKFETQHLLYTIPFVVYGIFRYLYLVYQRQEGGNPAEILLRDLPLGLAILGWLAVVVLVIY